MTAALSTGGCGSIPCSCCCSRCCCCCGRSHAVAAQTHGELYGCCAVCGSCCRCCCSRLIAMTAARLSWRRLQLLLYRQRQRKEAIATKITGTARTCRLYYRRVGFLVLHSCQIMWFMSHRNLCLRSDVRQGNDIQMECSLLEIVLQLRVGSTAASHETRIIAIGTRIHTNFWTLQIGGKRLLLS